MSKKSGASSKNANPDGVSYNYDFSEKTAQTGVPIITIIGLRGEF